MYFSNDDLIKNGARIGGGLMTPAHAKYLSNGQPDSYRLDWEHSEGIRKCMVDEMEFVMEASNADPPLNSRYGVYKFTVGGKNYFIFYVECFNLRKGTLHRGDVVCDFSTNFLHIHIKENAYGSGDKDYLHYLPYFDPRIKISDNWGGNAYNNLNKGEQIPSNITINNSEMINLPQAITIQLLGPKTNVRNSPKLPNDNSNWVREIDGNPILTETNLAGGDTTSGSNAWYQIGANEYIHASTATIINPGNTTLEAQVVDLGNQLATLKADTDKSISDLSVRVSDMNIANTALQHSNDILNQSNDTLTSTNDSLQKSNEDLKAKVETDRTMIDLLQKQNSGLIANEVLLNNFWIKLAISMVNFFQKKPAATDGTAE